MRAILLGILASFGILICPRFEALAQSPPYDLKILSFGEFASDPEPPYAKLSKAGENIAAAPGKRFGIEFLAHGTPKGAPFNLTLLLSRPSPENGKPSELKRYQVAYLGERGVAVWDFAFDYEIVSGTWTLSLLSAGNLLAQQSFNVVNANNPQPPATLPLPTQAPSPVQAQSKAASVEAKSIPPETPQAPIASVPRPSAPIQEQTPAAAPETQSSAAPLPTQPETKPILPQQEAKPVQAKPETKPAPAAPPQPLPQTAQQSAPKLKYGEVRPLAALTNPPGELYILQAGAFSEEANARQFSAHLATLGFAPCVFRDKTAQGPKFVVVAGKYNSLEQAKRAKQSFQAKEKSEPILKKTSAQSFNPLNCR